MNGSDIRTTSLPPAALTGRLAALAHPVRIEILRHLAERDACCCKDMVGRVQLAQSTVSQHLRVLVDSGLVRFEPDRQRSRYTIDRQAVEALAAEVSGLLGGVLLAAPSELRK